MPLPHLTAPCVVRYTYLIISVLSELDELPLPKINQSNGGSKLLIN